MALRNRIALPVIAGGVLAILFSNFENNPEQQTQTPEPSPTVTNSPINPIETLLSELVIQSESRAGYERELFMDNWSDFDNDGCDTRREVLIVESLIPVSLEVSCKIIVGQWYSAYDGVRTQDASVFDVDHFVPLAEAWDSGASLWSDEQRKLFANDLTDPDSLIAVSRESNRNKGDRDPAEWLPILPETHCWYVSTWVTIKHRWDLTVDEAEINAIRNVLRNC